MLLYQFDISISIRDQFKALNKDVEAHHTIVINHVAIRLILERLLIPLKIVKCLISFVARSFVQFCTNQIERFLSILKN